MASFEYLGVCTSQKNRCQTQAIFFVNWPLSGHREYDFAFIDADKGGYPTYYEQCLQLLRPGGIIAFDNTLRGGRVVLADDQVDDKSVGAMKILNDLVAKDSQRSYVVQLNIADGYTTDVKL